MAEIETDRTIAILTYQHVQLTVFPEVLQTADHDNSVANLDDPVVISLQLGDLLVKKVLLDPGSSANILFYSTFRKMKLSNNVIQPSTGDLDNTIATIHSNAREARECYNNSLKRPNCNTKAQIHNISNMKDQHMLADLDPRAGTLERPTPTEDLEKIYFTKNTDKFTYVGSTLSSEEKSSFQAFLQQHADLFAWTPADMPGIDPSIISHKLALDPSVRPIAQKKRNLGHDRKQAFLEETKKLIREIRFTTWLANVVMVKKHNGKWRIFMDAYSGYNQIQMYPSNQNKTAFITEYGNYCYKVMSFGLKNAGATYQRLMDKIFAKQIGRNIEVYVDDMIAKTKVGKNHFDDLTEIFGQLRKYNMRLNPEKCAFGVQSVLADFIAEFSVPSTTEDYIEWSLYVDGSSNPQGCGAGIILDDGCGNVIEQSLNFSINASNNQSEYEALVAGLRLAADLNITELKNLKIKQHFSSVEHPQTNGLAEAANKVILHALRKKLDDAKGLWAELIPKIIWGYNTTIHSTTKETPFHLVYGSDAMIPVEIFQSSLRTELADQTTQNIARQTELDLIEELRSSAAIKHLAMQQHIAQRYNQRLQPRSFQVHDLVLRKTEQARKPPAHGKLAANWEGPYRVTEIIGNGAYRLQTLEGKDLPNTWNVSSLKLYYS
ncbi:uncharacterized protein [Arachis hypogaea]|uniref:uncharacterized protein n=1 Tax=Arachis hypogaea TaxID=3818 RepID=UPI003B21D515